MSTKLDLLGNLIGKVDVLVIGGGMANTFLLAQGMPVGKSLCERDMADTAREIMAKAEAQGLRDPAADRRAWSRASSRRGAESSVVPIERCPRTP